MKKRISVLSVCFFVFLCVHAQDTIYSNVPKSNYLVTYDLFARCDTIEDHTGYFNSYGGDMARACYSKDTIVVYGIAGSMIPDDYFSRYYIDPQNDYYYADTTYTNCREAMRLYQYDSVNHTMTQLGEDLWVHVIDTPVTYYQKMGQPCMVYILLPEYSPDGTMPAFPVYEKYFSQPQVVSGQFFVGYTQQNAAREIYEGRVGFTQHSVCPLMIACADCDDPGLTVVHAHQRPYYQEYGIPEWKITPPHFDRQEWFLYPILTPNPADTVTDTTQTATSMTQVLERTVAVSPNPATDEVTIACGVGLSQVEVYDAVGHRVLTESASGMTYQFNVKGWAKGIYSVVVATPIGTTTKKLLVE